MSLEQRGELRFLLIDENESFVDTSINIFESLGYSANGLTAYSFEEISQAIANQEIDVVLLGSNIGGLCDIIEYIHNEEGLPVVLLFDNFEDEELIESTIQAGVIDYFPRRTIPEQYQFIAYTVSSLGYSHSIDETSEVGKSDRDLRQINEEYEVIFENVQDALFLIDVNYKNGDIEFVYRRLTDPYEDPPGPPSKQLEGLTPREAFGPEQGAEMERNYRRCISTAETISYEEEIERPGGISIWRTKLSPVITNGKVTQIVGSARDITAEKEREETLETFHDATRQLTESESKPEACEVAVNAAEDILGFSIVGVYLYREASGKLVNSALSTTLSESEDIPAEFEPGDSIPWQAYVEREPVTDTGEMEAVYGYGEFSPDVVIPIGSHGVMVVGNDAGSFKSEDLELTRILSATLEAALNHVAGKEALAEREAELKRQQNRADELEQLNSIIRDIEQVVVEESSKDEIEHAVCERLNTVPSYEYVWIGEPDVSQERLVPEASSGPNMAYIDTVTADLWISDGNHPAVQAYQNGEPYLIENVATDPTVGSWREIALRYGIQSTICVPIYYEETVHAVLSIESSTPDAFSKETKEALTDLARSIGYAITVTEREQSLQSEGTTELEFHTEDEGLFFVRASAEAGCTIQLDRTVRRAGDVFSMFYTIDGASSEKILKIADSTHSTKSAQVISVEGGGSTSVIEVTTPSWFGSLFSTYGGIIQSVIGKEGEGKIVVELPHGADIRTVVEKFQERYPKTELSAQRQRRRTIRSLIELQDVLSDELTDRQWEVLETAYSAGYFEWPRESSGEEVAELLGVAQPTFNKHLRIAERVAFGLLLDRQYPSGENTGYELSER